MPYSSYNVGGSAKPIVFIEPWTGHEWRDEALARHLGSDHPLYVIQPPPRAELRTMRSLYDLADYANRTLLSIGLEEPYHLIGWSIGGVAAYHMALRLGERVGFCGMVDCFIFTAWRLSDVAWAVAQPIHVLDPSVASAKLIAGRVKRGLGVQKHQLSVGFKAVAGEKLTFGAKPASEYDYERWRYHRMLIARRLTAIHRPVTFFTAEGTQARQKVDPLIDWVPYFLGGYEVRRLPGDHFSLWNEENIGAVAASFAEASDRAAGLPLPLRASRALRRVSAVSSTRALGDGRTGALPSGVIRQR